MRKSKRVDNRGQIALHIIFILMLCTYIVPLSTIISTSFSNDATVLAEGFQIVPNFGNLDFSAYRLIFKDATKIVQAYGTTALFTALYVVIDVVLMLLMAYPMSRLKYKFNRFLALYVLITMLISGGMIPTYVLISKYLKMKNTIWVYIIPSLIAPYTLMVFRTAYRSVPEDLYEAARIDGASELFVCFKIAIPLIKPTIAYIAFSSMVGKWNDWLTSRFYITEEKLYSLQYLLQKSLLDQQAIQTLKNNPMLAKFVETVSEDAYLFGMALVCAGPMLVAFPFFQKYFTKGVMVGSLKG